MDQPYWRGVLTGIIVGAGAALLLAPKRGEELRDELFESADDWKNNAAKNVHDVAKNAHDVTENVKENLSEVSASAADAAQKKLADAREIVAEKRDEAAKKVDEVTQKADDAASENSAGDHHEVEVGAALAQAMGDDEMLAQAEGNGEVNEVQNVAGDDIAPSPGVRDASEKTLHEIQTQSPASNTEPEEAQAAQAQPLEDKISAAVEVAREADSPAETVTEKAEEVTEAVADKASEAADAAAEKANDSAEKTPDAVIDAPEDSASENQPAKNGNSKQRGKNRRKRSANS